MNTASGAVTHMSSPHTEQPPSGTPGHGAPAGGGGGSVGPGTGGSVGSEAGGATGGSEGIGTGVNGGLVDTTGRSPGMHSQSEINVARNPHWRTSPSSPAS